MRLDILCSSPALFDVAGHPLPQLRFRPVERVLRDIGDRGIQPARAQIMPICEPIAPAPTTTTFLISVICHRPWKTGRRLARNASAPSFLSSVV